MFQFSKRQASEARPVATLPALTDSNEQGAAAGGELTLVASSRDVSQAELPPMTTRMLRPADLGTALIEAWDALEERACQPNAYLSSSFILPAIEHLTPSADIRIFVVEEPSNALNLGILRGLGVFQVNTPTRAVPVRHLAAYESIHTFLGGLLIDRDHTTAAMRSLFRFLAQPEADWHAVYFSKIPTDAAWVNTCHQEAKTCGLQWHETSSVLRSVLTPAAISEDYIHTRLQSRSKDCARLRRQLSKQGEVTWELLRGEQVSLDHAERFLELENMGWKADEGTSLLSRQNETRFFREIVKGFRRRGQTFFTELKVDGKAIASTSNFISGKAGFAFKVGWNPEYSRYSPGIVNEFEFVGNASSRCADLEYIDSGSEPGSFIDSMWLDRRTLVSGVYPTSSLGEKAIAAVSMVRRLIKRG